MRSIAFLLAPLIVAAPLLAASPKIASTIAAAVADPNRPKDQREADALRKPAETLVFSGVRPGMTVGEFYPAGGISPG
jgi:predicted methyltransferase